MGKKKVISLTDLSIEELKEKALSLGLTVDEENETVETLIAKIEAVDVAPFDGIKIKVLSGFGYDGKIFDANKVYETDFTDADIEALGGEDNGNFEIIK